jgi:hypothetical protein
MTRGKKPSAAVTEAEKFAERMGYHWIENPEPDLPFDFLIYKPDSIRVVKVRLTRNLIDPEGFYEKMFPDDVVGMRSLPFPPFIIRELWLRTRGERVWRRLEVTPISVGEIEWWGPDKYVNPHVRKEEPGPVGPPGKFIVIGSRNTRPLSGKDPKQMPRK